MSMTTCPTPILTPAKHNAIYEWSRAIPSLRLHYVDPTAHFGPLKPIIPLLDAYDDEVEVDDTVTSQRQTEPVGTQYKEEMKSAWVGGNGYVIDWTYFHPERRIPWAPWEFVESRERGFYTDMSGLTGVSVSTTRSMLKEGEEDEDEHEEDNHERDEHKEEKDAKSDREEDTDTSSTSSSRNKCSSSSSNEDDTGSLAIISYQPPSISPSPTPPNPWCTTHPSPPGYLVV